MRKKLTNLNASHVKRTFKIAPALAIVDSSRVKWLPQSVIFLWKFLSRFVILLTPLYAGSFRLTGVTEITSEFSGPIAETARQLQRILEDGRPKVVAIKGNWGTGKTYFWNKFRNSSLCNSPTGYVSLLGIVKLSSLREAVAIEAVVEKTVDVTTETFSENWKEQFARLRREIKNLLPFSMGKLAQAGYLPDGYVTTLIERSAIPRGWVLCLDDFERSSIDKVAMMGYIATLRDEYEANVVLILSLDDIDEEKFQIYREKTIDREIMFRPSIEGLVEIACSNLQKTVHDSIVRRATVLGVDNIRILIRLDDLLKEICEFLKTPPSDEFLNSIASSLLLFLWVKLGKPTSGLSFDILLDFNGYFSDPNDEQKAVLSLLQEYDYAYTDDLDKELIEIVRDDKSLSDFLNQEQDSFQKLVRQKFISDKRTRVWNMYSRSFSDDAQEFGDALATLVMEHLTEMPLEKLDADIGMVRDIHPSGERLANWLVAELSQVRASEIFGYKDAAFGGIKDIGLRQVANSLKPPAESRSLEEIFLSLAANRRDINHADLLALSTFNQKQILDYLLHAQQPKLIRTFGSVYKYVGAFREDPEITPLQRTLSEVCKKISRTSRLNWMRVNAAIR